MRDFLLAVLLILDFVVVGYFFIYMAVNVVLLFISNRVVPRELYRTGQSKKARKPDPGKTFYPLVSLIVPAYCEEVTIVENIRSLIRLDYPRFEIIVVNDGSSDRTVALSVEAFGMVRSEVDYNPHLGTMPISGYYRATVELPKKVERLVLLDKANGGKADAINAGINASQGSYVASMDADSLLVDDAVELAITPIFADPNDVVACGGAVALSNGCTVKDGRLASVGLPKKWIARFQVVEYMRSFTQSRTALGQMNALLILSGVFAVFQREALVEAGGFLTKHMRSKLGTEYCGVGSETVCEDMEVVVRLHRYLLDKGRKGRSECLPFPLAWTEAPEIWEHLGKQRNRWYRGLWEVLSIHRGMMMRPRYGRIGMFALPYQFLFEALAPLLETAGYIVVPLSFAAGILSLPAMVSFVSFALAFNLMLSAGSVYVSIRRMRLEKSAAETVLMDYRGAKTILLLVFAGLLSNLGYRQYLIWWQLKGLKDFLQGRKSWDKFARQGFAAEDEA